MENGLVEKAMRVAYSAHEGQYRKGSALRIPYIVHPLTVGAMLSAANCSTEVISAGILHDVLEDTRVTFDYLKAEFGEKVAYIIKGCSEPDKSLPWEERKRDAIENMKSAPLEVLLVSCADKTHNLQFTRFGYEIWGDSIWQRFKRGKDLQEKYYRGLAEVFASRRAEGPILDFLYTRMKNELDAVFGDKS